LCVVVVTICAFPIGLGCRPVTTRPAMCAMSANSSAPTSSAMARKRAKSMMRE
jgi:hypothetical protein